ncbi:spore germination protein QC [Gracilibacillus halophilus YIM-C55.5]|uniref:Spore germination protein QC n=1 Tax=Gracilibacillus halophilus YIM-C55.5 TaxID=1308866 RepID=N4WQS4_9BACI|nr:Ger(x)C family spore germination protein [Gracilibacillus halophilus]ENH96805.1 spore germination protein QC [Gracilibacillus halophilus YIM-C55.5]
MKTINFRCVLIASMGLITILSGCIQTEIIDDIELVMSAGYDWDSTNQQYMGTAVAPLYGSSEEKNMRQHVSYSAEGKTVESIRSKIETKTPKPVEQGTLLNILFGEELAKKGVQDILYGINENPVIGRGLHLAIAQGEAQSLLKQQINVEQTLPRYLDRLIKSNTKKNIPRINLHDFNYRLTGEGMDPFLPIVQYDPDESSLNITGIALFKDDKMVDQIHYDQFFLFTILYQPTKDNTYQFFWEEKDTFITISSINSKEQKRWITKDKGEIEVNVTGILTETNKVKLNTIKEKNRLEQAISKKLKEEAAQLITLFQELEIDPLMMGTSAKATFRDWRAKTWKERYPDTDIKANITINLEQSNITEE